MAVTINGSGTIAGISVGGLPDGIVDTDMIAANAVTAAKRGTGAILQVITTTKTDVYTTVNTTVTGSHPWGDDVSGLTADITMTSASNKVLALLNCSISNSHTNYYTYLFLYRLISGTHTFLGGTTAKTGSGSLHTNDVVINRLDTPGAGTHTYYARLAAEGNTSYLGKGQNGTSDERIGDSTLILMEVAV